MNASKPLDVESAQTPVFDPFPEPQTMPKGWDVSGLVSTVSLSVDSGTAPEPKNKYRYPGFIYD